MDNLVAAYLGFEPQDQDDSAAPPANAEESMADFERLFAAAGGRIS